MVVQCPHCSSRYRVNEQNIPASGGRIRCPSCQETFVVYPEAGGQQQQSAPSSGPSYDAEKTSVATNINDLMGSLGNTGQGGQQGQGAKQQGGGQQHAEPSDEALKTEVLSGDSLPNFSGGFNQGGGGRDSAMEDGTVEMQNPLKDMDLGDPSTWGQRQQGGQQESEGSYDATQVASPDMLDDGSDRTEIVDPDAMGHINFAQHPQEDADDRTEIVDSDSVFGAQAGQQRSSGQQSAHQQPPSQPGQQQGPPSFQGGAQQQRHQQQQPPAFGSQQQPQRQSDSFAAQASSSPSHQPPPQQQPPQGGGQQGGQQQAPKQGGGAGPQQEGPDPTHEGPWKLKTNFGLTYEFADTKSLLSWMSNRDDFDGYTLSGGNNNFFPLSAFPQIADRVGDKLGAASSSASQANGAQSNAAAPAQQQQRQQSGPQQGVPSQGGFGGGGSFNDFPSPPSSSPSPSQQGGQGPQRTQRSKHSTMPPTPVVNNESKLPSRDAKWNKVLWALFVVLFVGCAILVAQISGVINIKQMLGISQPQQTTPAPTPTTPPAAAAREQPTSDTPAPNGEGGAEEAATAEVTPEQRAQVNKIIEDAQRAMENNKFSSARRKLETAAQIDPERFQIYDALSEVYGELGESDKAERARKKAQTLRQDAIQGGEEIEEEPPAIE